jgi:multidrug efflux pump subunit AcrA (membrane-fusion protein)
VDQSIDTLRANYDSARRNLARLEAELFSALADPDRDDQLNLTRQYESAEQGMVGARRALRTALSHARAEEIAARLARPAVDPEPIPEAAE